jgi:hypothetical protein
MAIVRAADDHAIDVLVVGNAGMAGRKEFLLGNVPNRISHALHGHHREHTGDGGRHGRAALHHVRSSPSRPPSLT